MQNFRFPRGVYRQHQGGTVEYFVSMSVLGTFWRKTPSVVSCERVRFLVTCGVTVAKVAALLNGRDGLRGMLPRQVLLLRFRLFCLRWGVGCLIYSCTAYLMVSVYAFVCFFHHHSRMFYAAVRPKARSRCGRTLATMTPERLLHL